MHIAAAHHPPTTRRHYPAGQRMKGVVDRLFARQNPGAMSLSCRAREKPIFASPCIRARARGRFFNLVDLVNQLEQEKAAGRSGRLSENLLRYDLIVIDELGYLPFSQPGGQLLFHLISKLYENAITHPLAMRRDL